MHRRLSAKRAVPNFGVSAMYRLKVGVKQVRGVALFLSLVLLIVLTLVAVGIMSNTVMQERMAGNQKRIADASMAAEAAIAQHLEWLRGGVQTRWGSVEPPHLGAWSAFGDNSRFMIESWSDADDLERENACAPGMTRCVVSVRGESVAGQSAALARTRLEAEFIFGQTTGPESADILCGENLNLSRVRFRNTLAHCDGATSVVATSGEGAGQNSLINSVVTSRHTASVPVQARNCVDCDVKGNSTGPAPPPIELRVRGDWEGNSFFEVVKSSAPSPDVAFFVVDSDYNAGAEIGKVQVANDVESMGSLDSVAECGASNVHTCDFTGLASSTEPKVLFCNGNANFGGGGSNPISNLTVIATCDITHNGRASQALREDGEREINNVFYAGRNMTFNGRTTGNDSELFGGRFFAGGDIEFNGNVDVEGQVVAEGSITANGWLTFLGANLLGGGMDDVVERVLFMSSWRQRWFDEVSFEEGDEDDAGG